MGLFSRKTAESQDPWEGLSEEQRDVIPESWKDFTKDDIKHLKACSGRIYETFGTQGLDDVFSYYAPVHEKKLDCLFKGVVELREKQDHILANQQQIMEELAAIRHAYQTPVKNSTPSYHPSDAR